jgi:hypothetical protein
MLAALISFDQLLQTLVVAPFALARLAPVPDPDATISGVLGRNAGRSWARLPLALVDALFLLLTLGVERDHCAKVAARENSRACAS